MAPWPLAWQTDGDKWERGGPQGWGRAPGTPPPSPAQHADWPHSTGQGIKPCSPSTPASGLQETPSHFPPPTPAPTSPAMQPPTNAAPPGSPRRRASPSGCRLRVCLLGKDFAIAARDPGARPLRNQQQQPGLKALGSPAPRQGFVPVPWGAETPNPALTPSCF